MDVIWKWRVHDVVYIPGIPDESGNMDGVLSRFVVQFETSVFGRSPGSIGKLQFESELVVGELHHLVDLFQTEPTVGTARSESIPEINPRTVETCTSVDSLLDGDPSIDGRNQSRGGVCWNVNHGNYAADCVPCSKLNKSNNIIV